MVGLAVPGVQGQDVREQPPGAGRGGEQAFRGRVAQPVEPGHGEPGDPGSGVGGSRLGGPVAGGQRDPFQCLGALVTGVGGPQGALHRDPGPHERGLGRRLLGQPALHQVGARRLGGEDERAVGAQGEVGTRLGERLVGVSITSGAHVDAYARQDPVVGRRMPYIVPFE